MEELISVLLFTLSIVPPAILPMTSRLRSSITVNAGQALHTSQIAHNILGLAEVDLLQQIPHLALHILDQLANIDHMTCIRRPMHLPEGVSVECRLQLPRHTPRQRHLILLPARCHVLNAE